MKALPIKSWVPVAIAFAASRIVYFCLGVRFDASPLVTHYQYLDPALLRDNLLQSIYYLHMQPPLFNLFLGVVLKLFPSHWALAFNVIYLLLGLVLSLATFQIMQRLGVPSRMCSWLTILFIVSPACVLYENYLFYTYPVTTLLALLALCLHRLMERPGLLNACMFFFLLAAVVLTRSLFHMAWLLFFTVAVLFSKRQYFRRLATPAAVSLALVFFWYAKNMYVFGEFSSSSFFGMSFSKMTTFVIPEDERRQLVQEGKLSELSLIPPFSGIEAYEKVLPKTKRTGIPALDLKQKTGMIRDCSRNYIGYVYLSRQYLRDALHSLGYRPLTYLVSILKSGDIFFRPASNYVFLAKNRQKIEPISRFYNLVFLGQILDTSRESLPSKDHSSGYYANAFFRMGLFLAIAFCGLLVFGFGLWRKALSQQPVDVPFTLTVMFLWTNVLYVATVGNCFEMGENFRFRFMIDPFVIVLLGLFLHSLRKRFIKNAAEESAPFSV